MILNGTRMINSVLLLTLITSGNPSADQQQVIVVVGAPGAEEYGEQFNEWSDRWEEASSKGNARFQRIGSRDGEAEDRVRLKQTLAGVAAESAEPLWLVAPACLWIHPARRVGGECSRSPAQLPDDLHESGQPVPVLEHELSPGASHVPVGSLPPVAEVA